MAAKQYRVVQATWQGGKRVEIEIGTDWKAESKAKEEMRQLSIQQPGKVFSLQKKK